MTFRYLAHCLNGRCLKNCDITDMTFACIGGVDALQNSLDWISSNTGKKAIVVCSDLSKYSLNSTGEYTQGAGAVALLLSENPSILSIENQWGVATKSENDFFKPRRTFEKKKLINEIIKNLDLDLSESEFEKKFSESPFWSDQNERIEVHKEEPVFDGQYSNECYIDRMDEAFEHFSSFKKIDFLNQWNHLIFHLPYAFHGRRMIFNNWLSWIRKDEKMKDLIEEIGEDSSEDWVKKAYKSDLYKDFIRKKIMPGELASSEIGNMYTASIFMSLLSMLSHQLQNSNNIIGNKVGFISYGSGSKSKIFNGTTMNGWKEKIEPVNLFDHLSNRKEISFQIYEDLHSNKNIDPITNHSIRFSHLQDSPNSEGYRKYKL